MDAVGEIKQRLSIEDVVAQYVELKRAGRNFKGLSPFGSEKTPSFIVSPEKQIWHDFSSGKGGDMFSFIMEMEGLDFRGALEMLARKAGVDLDQFGGKKSGPSTKLKSRLFDALELATKFYQVQFSRNSTAIDYVFKKRQFTRQTALDFKLGYSPNNGRALLDFMVKKGFTEKELSQAGLITERYDRLSDMFRGRLMVPLRDPSGRIIGFTARLLEDIDNAPKYINTPQTILYDKSRHVYGLSLAKEAIRTSNIAVLVEGNLDVIASHQAGVKNVVATAGTALTEQHLKTINRFASDVRLAFDADKAGIGATERSIPIASKLGVSLSIVTIKDAKDPDELIKKDPKLWEKAIAKNSYALDWLIDKYQEQLDISTGKGKRAFTDVILPTIKDLEDSVEQDHYLTKVAKLLDVSVSALREKMTIAKKPTVLKKRSSEAVKMDNDEHLEWAKAQDHLLSIVLMRPDIRTLLEILDAEMFPQKNAQILYNYLVAHPDFDGDLSKAPILQDVTDYVKILSLQYEALFKMLDEVEARYESHRLRARLITIYVKTKKAQLREALKEASDSEERKLLTRAIALDHLLKLSKEGS
jgi:DNA primase